MAHRSRAYSASQSAGDMAGERPEQNLHANGLSIRTEWLEDTRTSVVYVTGKIDWNTSRDLRLEVTRCLALDHPEQLIVDLEGVDHVDSSGVGTLVETWRNANRNSVHLALCGVNASLRRVLERIGLDSIVDIRATAAMHANNFTMP